jgi:hypothetical protein
MRNVYITFSGAAYDRTTRHIVERAPQFGADHVMVYDDLWLTKQEFYTTPSNAWLWQHRGPGNPDGGRGFGWFAWKPFIILDALARANEGDVILYTDADTYPVSSLAPVYDHARKHGVMLFAASGHINRWWVKRDAYITMGLDGQFVDAKHACARFMLFRADMWTVRQFLMEWLTYCVNPVTTTFDASELAAEHEGFRESRSEQAIFSLLSHKYGYKLHREACQFGDGFQEDRALYPQVFEQDGRKDAQTLRGSAYFNLYERKLAA